ncbi:MAG: hypothetical protein JW827_02935, partial [Spirochaetes bacterium]|nr:hypothetical protein [Spirochaetota bacterium]
MSRLYLFLLVVALIFSTSPAFAQYTPTRVTISTAEVTVGGSAVTNMTVTIRNRFTHAAATKIVWTNVQFGSTEWKIGNHYADIDFNCSVQKWYIVLSTDNTNPSIANPRFKGSGNDAAGLINTYNSNQSLELVWQIQTATGTPVLDPPIDQGGGSFAFTNANWNWKWILDKAETGFVDTTPNTNIANGPATSSLPIKYYAVSVAKGVNQGVTAGNGDNDGRLWGA